MRAIVTGADGFVGRWLTRHLEESGDEVLQACGEHAASVAHCTRLDVTDGEAVGAFVRDVRPDVIYHLAAIAFGPAAGADMARAISITVGGTVNVLEAARAVTTHPIVMIPSSSEVYGRSFEPLTERAVIRPINLYGASKAAQEVVALAYDRSSIARVVVARAFNHIGPGQSESFVVPAFAGQLADVALGRAAPVIRVGRLDSERDFTDVRDVVQAYRLLVTGGHTGRPFNVASGLAVSVRAILADLIALSGRDVVIEEDQGLLRRIDRPRVVGSSERLYRATRWRPTRSLKETLSDVWRDALNRRR